MGGMKPVLEIIGGFPSYQELAMRDGLVELAAERLGVTPESLLKDGCDEKWFSDPQNMPPPPGSACWVKSGHPLYAELKRLLDDGEAA